MLQECPACDRQVSSAAAACPHCGHPIGRPTDSERSERTVTTQETGKIAKINQAMGVLVILVGAGLATVEGPVGALVMGIGLVWLIGARIYGWWHYG